MALPTQNKKHKHDCDKCTYLGTYTASATFDMYHCMQGSKGNPTLICRYGSDGPEYMSGLHLAPLNPYMALAYVLAKKAGLYLREDEE